MTPIVVTGFSRCGSTMTMRMLFEGGVAVYADNGASFETDDVKRLPAATAWLDAVGARAFKLLEPRHFRLPANRAYRFIALSRDATEQANSHSYFMAALGSLSHEMTRRQRRALAASLARDNDALPAWLAAQYPGSTVLTLTFEGILRDARLAAELIRRHVAPTLDVESAAAVVLDRPARAQRDDLLIEKASLLADEYDLPIALTWARLRQVHEAAS